ncbi:MAG: substrate-binding domain-containing protein, partial [Emcibacteraceae bacterium]|nr:substrate-binding domain-containing protein [Emcibacteraceae bacterium]
FMNDGFGTERYPLMQNDYVLVGPANDPANISLSHSAIEAFEKIINSSSSFVSRGDESGTHKAEKRILTNAKINPNTLSSDQYIITGSGMGRTLAIASEKSAYVLTDNATWISFNNKGNLRVLYKEDPAFENKYSVITANPHLFSHISNHKQELVMNWFKSAKAAKTIDRFQIAGKPIFKSLLIAK